jgi:hypothetical protein
VGIERLLASASGAAPGILRNVNLPRNVSGDPHSEDDPFGLAISALRRKIDAARAVLRRLEQEPLTPAERIELLEQALLTLRDGAEPGTPPRQD